MFVGLVLRGEGAVGGRGSRGGGRLWWEGLQGREELGGLQGEGRERGCGGQGGQGGRDGEGKGLKGGKGGQGC